MAVSIISVAIGFVVGKYIKLRPSESERLIRRYNKVGKVGWKQ